MAVLGSIRKRGVILVVIIGLGLFAFIAEELFRSCDAQSNERRQQVGEVLGKKISVQDFQKLVDEYQEVIKITQGRDNLTENELNRLKDEVWNTYVNNQILNSEAKKLGITVTDAELQDVLREGTNPMLMQSPFVNQQTGRFDASMLTKFLDDYKKLNAAQNPQMAEQYQVLYNYWNFIEKTLRQQILTEKYQRLLAGCLISNPVSAKMAFDDNNVENNIQLASVAYSSINDKDVTVSDADLKAKYNENKDKYKQYFETRDIKYVDFQVLPSVVDRQALMQTMKEAYDALQSGNTPADVVKKAQSQVPYTGIAVTKKALPRDIMAKIDSLAVGETTAPFETRLDNTMNVIKLISKAELPDSVEYRMIQVGGATADEAHKRADSIYAALSAGAEFEALAKKYGQEGSKQWITSAMYENSSSVDADTKAYLEALNTLGANEMKNISFAQGNIILQVTARKAMVTKYVAAIVKHTIDFSKETYSAAYNKFSQYVSESQTLEALEKNAAKYGFKVQERKDVFNSEHNVAGVRSTRDAMKWIFDSKAGEISPLYECGDNDHLMVVALTKVHPVGYRDMDDVKDLLKAEVMTDKKFEQIKSKLAGVSNVAGAKGKGAVVSDVNLITFNAPVFVSATGSSEPALSGAVAGTKQGQFCNRVIKGNGGAYMFQVVKKAQRSGVKFDVKAMEGQLQQQALQAASRFMQELYLKADVVDNRYLFF
ncbi:peptidylprolyl isomerase [Xylanibacter muris]|uniref:Periplasmic chaperone PpiD n=1 Tax=Xylanibacter muris TaxID=2736290 RepID=A0ABX2AKJ2_9BACT|nr:peptidylprolyl isomerase [Xylanibacter muris]NPD91275.1 peptidylprolyl isomerase [Xylanibacter muris]